MCFVITWPLLFILLLFLKPSAQDLQSGVSLVTSVSNSFVPKLFQALAPGRENLVFAPFGLISNLGMLLEGTDGTAAQEIIKGLNVSPGLREELRVGFKAYFDSFESAAANEEAAGAFNMVMLRSSGVLSPSYKSVLSHYYRANITENANFDQRPGVQVLELRSDSGVMSHWKDYHRLAAFAFLSHVASAPFFRSARETVSVPMVPQVGIFRSGRIEHLLCHAIQLPLEVDTVNLLLLLPDSSDHLDELIVKLTDISLHQIVNSLEYRETEVSLPQLAILTSGLDLTPFLRQLGIKSVFNSSGVGLKQASRLNSTLIYVKSVTQDAYFSTSFVAVNTVGSISSNVVSKRPKRETSTLIFDRPFLFFLLHRDTQLVLLAGKVQNPTQVP